MSKVLLLGGHGKIALLAAPLLVEQGHEVTSVFRNPDHADEVAATGATPKVVDIETLSADGFAELERGFDAVVFSAGAGGGNPTRTYAVDRDAAIHSIDAAATAGVRRYVMVSYYGAGPQHGVPEDSSFYPYADAKAAADEHLRASGLDWTIVAPSTLTLDDPTGRIAVKGRTQSADKKPDPSDTSRANVAAVIAAVLDDDRSIGTMLEFVDGDEAITDAVAG